METLTIKSTFGHTPLSRSTFGHCPHSDAVFSVSIQFSQNDRGCRRWDGEGSCTAPRSCPTSSVFHLVLRDGHTTIGSVPSHPQSWCPWCHCPDQRNTTNSIWYRGICQRNIRMKHYSIDISPDKQSRSLSERLPSTEKRHPLGKWFTEFESQVRITASYIACQFLSHTIMPLAHRRCMYLTCTYKLKV